MLCKFGTCKLCACVCAWGEETHQKRWIQLLLCSTRSDVHAHKSAENNRNGSRASHLPRSESARQGTALLVLRSLIWCFWLRPPFGGCRSDEQRRRKRFRWTTVAGGRDLGGGLYPPVAVAPKRAWTNLGLILAEHEQRKLLPPEFGAGITPFLRVGWPFPTDSFSPQPTWSRLDGSAGNTVSNKTWKIPAITRSLWASAWVCVRVYARTRVCALFIKRTLSTYWEPINPIEKIQAQESSIIIFRL